MCTNFDVGHTWIADFNSVSVEYFSVFMVGGTCLFIKWRKSLPILVFTDLL